VAGVIDELKWPDFAVFRYAKLIEEDEKGEPRIARYRGSQLWFSAYSARHLEQMRLVFVEGRPPPRRLRGFRMTALSANIWDVGT
jgi:hypothetical protein